jgi:endonuclease-3
MNRLDLTEEGSVKMGKAQSLECLEEIFDLLEALWHREKKSLHAEPFQEPLDGLILTVLSQNTNDANRDKAFQSLKRRYASWHSVAAAGVDDVADAIRSAGIANNKARSILAILAALGDDFGSYSLKALATWPPERARAYLEALPGVGPKTAACVLLFDLAMPAFPADTHVSRLCRRIGWVSEKMSPGEIQSVMESALPQERYMGAHLNLIEHGRHVCKARSPLCGACVIRHCCDFGRR